MAKKKKGDNNYSYSSLSGSASSSKVGIALLAALVVAGVVVTVTVVATKHHDQVQTEPPPPPPTHLLVVDNYNIFTGFLLGMIDLWHTIYLFDTNHNPVLNITVYNASSTTGDFGPELDVWSTNGVHYIFVANGSFANNTASEFLVNITLASHLRRHLLGQETEFLVHLTIKFRYSLSRFQALLVRESDYTLWPSADACAQYCTGGDIFCRPYDMTPGVWECKYNDEMHSCQDCCDSRCDPDNFTCIHPVPHASCDESIGGNRTCTCYPGFNQTDEGGCEDIDECGDNDADDDDNFNGGVPVCGNRSTGFDCWNTPGSYECIPCRSPAILSFVADAWEGSRTLYQLDERCEAFTAFVLPVPNARLGGRDGASKLCQEEANRHGLRGEFVAALSTTDESVAQFLQRSGQTYLHTTAYVLPDRSVIAFDRQGFMPAVNFTGLQWAGQLIGDHFDMMANGTIISEDLALPYPLFLSGSDPFDPSAPWHQILAHEQFGSTCADWTSDSADMQLVGGYLRYWGEFCGGYPWCWSRRLILQCDGKNGTGFVPVITDRHPMTLQMFIPCVGVTTYCTDGTVDYGNGTCTEFDECIIPELNEICTGAELTCVDQLIGFTCNCSTPVLQFDLETEQCLPYDACVERQDLCPFFSECNHTTLQPYVCSESCLEGFTGPDCRDINECADEMSCPPAEAGFFCNNSLGSFTCDPCNLPAIGDLNITSNLSDHCTYSHIFLQPLDSVDVLTLLADGATLDQVCQLTADANNLSRDGRPFRAMIMHEGQLPFNLSMITPLVDVAGFVWVWAMGELGNALGPRAPAFDRLANGQRTEFNISDVHLVITDIEYDSNTTTLSGGDCSSWNALSVFAHMQQFIIGVAEHWHLFQSEEAPIPWVYLTPQSCLVNETVQINEGISIHYAMYCVEEEPAPPVGVQDSELTYANWGQVFDFLYVP